MSKRLVEKTISTTNIITTDNSESIDLDGAASIAIQCVIDVNTPAAVEVAAATDVDATENSYTQTAHGFTTGLKGQWTTSAADLPDGLATSTDYFVIVVDADTFKVASSLANALAGTAVDIIDVGTGDHTFTPTSLAGASVKLQKSNDASNWDDVASATSITADGNVWLEDDAPGYRYARISYTLTAGRLSASNYVLVKS